MDELEIITTSDGSHTLRNNLLGETYHSVHGAIQESMHVFIKNGLAFFRHQHPAVEVSILEVGFGTGLNALVALQYALKCKVNIRYTTLEPFPLNEKVWSKLNYGDEDRGSFDAIHRASWEREVAISPVFTLHKMMASLDSAELAGSYDIVFFDAFAPSVQPGMWTFDSLKKAVDRMNLPGVFVTYSAKGQVKRDLRTLGLSVETLPGPPGKLQMIRACR